MEHFPSGSHWRPPTIPARLAPWTGAKQDQGSVGAAVPGFALEAFFARVVGSAPVIQEALGVN